MVDLIERPVDHFADQVPLVGFGDDVGADQLPVAQHRDTVGDLEDLLHPVADIDDRDALAVQAPDQREELVGLGAGQVAGRLVEHQEPGAPAGSAGGRDQLLLTDGQVAQHRVGRQVEAQLIQDRLGSARHLPLAEQSEAGGLVPKEDVGRHRQVRTQHDFLVDGVDAEHQGVLGAGELDLPALPQDGAGGLGIDPRQQLDQRRFAGPVLADDGVDLPRHEAEADRLQRVGAGKLLVELAQFQGRDARFGRLDPGGGERPGHFTPAMFS